MNSRVGPDIHWHEGMLLMPQHFQAFGNALTSRLQDAALTRGPFSWGVLDLHLELSEDELRVTACDLILKDGSRVVVSGDSATPGNTVVSGAAFRAEFAALPKDRPLEVWLGVPESRADVSVVDDNAGRYSIQGRTLRDENSADPNSTTDISVRFLRGKLFFGSQSHDHFTTIKIAEITRTDAHDLRPRLSPGFIPPLLDVTANAGLRQRLADIHVELARVNQAVGSDVATRPFSMLLQAGGNPEALFKLNATNMLLPAVALLSRSRGVHPLQTYTVLTTLVGALAVFAPERRCPDMPPYDHEDLSGCFDRVLAIASRLLRLTWSVSWDVAEFVPVEGSERALVCHRPKDWIGSSRQQYLAVSADLPARDIELFVTEQIRLMGSGDFLGEVRRAVVQCVRLAPPARSPDRLPPPENWLYFVIERVKTNAERLRVYDESESVYIVMERAKPANLNVSLYAVRQEEG